MFDRIPEPLAYAEQLLATFGVLSQAADQGALMIAFASQACVLTGCDLAQVYLLDASHSTLGLAAECLNGKQRPSTGSAQSVDYHNDELLQFSLCQNRVLCLDTLGDGLYSSSFLPSSHAWCCLLCVPLTNAAGNVGGLFVCASVRPLELRHFAGSLGRLGSFVLGQAALMLRLRGTFSAPVAADSSACAGDYGLIGSSAAMRKIYQLISKVLHSSYTVLLNGETGTGKEVVARALHEGCSRRSKSFIVQNCAAFPEDLLESELFGYRKGAFTGADRDRIGLFEAADGGTLLLDEVGDMPLALQAKLLRVLQEGEIRPLGSTKTRKVDVRIITATHRDLPAMVAQGKFREDLYYRIAQFPISLPPLRERGSDVHLLAEHFVVKACKDIGRGPLRWSETAQAHLAGHSFPGNVRQLKAMVERAALLCDGDELCAVDFGTCADAPAEAAYPNLRDYLEHVERAYLLGCLRRNNGNQTVVARQLGLARRTLLYRLERLNIDQSEFQA
nr:sigma 54-interacting transcriptional regulator [uncultured Pseudomonas sp.]